MLARAALARAVLATGLVFLASSSPRAAPGKSFFFATPEACAASLQFGERECANAFFNVEAEFDQRAPVFASRMDCVDRFQQCGRAPDRTAPGEEAFRPLMLGVEISAKGAVPVLAVVNPPEMFASQPISRLKASRSVASWGAPILTPDRFEPFRMARAAEPTTAFEEQSPKEPFKEAAAKRFEARVERPDPLAQARRLERLKDAPFIE